MNKTQISLFALLLHLHVSDGTMLAVRRSTTSDTHSASSCARAPHARAGPRWRLHAADRAVELTAHVATTALAPLIMPLSLVVADSMVGALGLTARDDRHTPSAKILLARRTRSSGARCRRDGRRHVVRHRLHLGARLSSVELDSTATVVIELSRHLFCLLSVGRPSLVCVSPARTRLIERTAPQPHMTCTPERLPGLCVPFGAGPGQIWGLILVSYGFPVLCSFPGTLLLSRYFAAVPCAFPVL